MGNFLSLDHPLGLRLLVISPGSNSEPLRLEIYRSILDDTNSPSYEALSYVWGRAEKLVDVYVLIRLDSKVVINSKLSIGQNLADALRHLRSPLTTRILWADALCINQQDNVERVQQVLIMADIYRLASKVVAFLGPEANDSSCAMDLIDGTGNMIEVDFSTGLVQKSTAGVDEPEWSDMYQTLPFGRREFLSIYHLLHREWFERLWVRQEIGLGGRKGVLQCDNKTIGWPSFCRALFVIRRKPFAPSFLDFAQLRTFQDRLKEADTVALYAMRTFGFVNLRAQIGHSKCLDPRDRIYGILSQLSEKAQIKIIPDYGKSVIEVYTDITQRHIKYFDRLDILSQCELDERRSALRLPSWVPDWSTPRKSEKIHELAPKLFHLMPSFSYMDQRLLRAYGMYITRVDTIIPLNQKILDCKTDIETVRELRRLLLELAKDRNVQTTYKSRQSFLQACCRNLWLNNYSDRWIPPAPHVPSFNDCLTVISTILDSTDTTSDLSSLQNIARCLERCREACTARILFITEDGQIGIVSDSVAVRDEVCYLFGCFKPLMLRQNKETTHSSSSVSEYRVVGECHVDGAMYGEFVLGNKPENLRGLLTAKYNYMSSDLWPPGLLDSNTNVVYKEDSRVETFLRGLKQKGLLTEPTLEDLARAGAMDTLIKAGFSIRTFELI